MNFVFISPHFPENYWNFCDRLRANGVNVLGIGDAPYETLPALLKSALTEYYRVDNMENYDEMLRAMGFFTFKYGRIDWVESNNEYWLEQDARLRTDFNITTGIKSAEIEKFKRKSMMKTYYQKAGIPTARWCVTADVTEAQAFAKTVGWPARYVTKMIRNKYYMYKSTRGVMNGRKKNESSRTDPDRHRAGRHPGRPSRNPQQGYPARSQRQSGSCRSRPGRPGK